MIQEHFLEKRQVKSLHKLSKGKTCNIAILTHIKKTKVEEKKRKKKTDLKLIKTRLDMTVSSTQAPYANTRKSYIYYYGTKFRPRATTQVIHTQVPCQRLRMCNLQSYEPNIAFYYKSKTPLNLNVTQNWSSIMRSTSVKR